MIRLPCRVSVLIAAACLPQAAFAQLGEVHLGSLVTYGTARSYGPGAGLGLGVAAGRLVYLGARWT